MKIFIYSAFLLFYSSLFAQNEFTSITPQVEVSSTSIHINQPITLKITQALDKDWRIISPLNSSSFSFNTNITPDWNIQFEEQQIINKEDRDYIIKTWIIYPQREGNISIGGGLISYRNINSKQVINKTLPLVNIQVSPKFQLSQAKNLELSLLSLTAFQKPMVSIEQQIKQTNKPIALDTSDTQSLNKNYLKKTFMYLLTIVGLWLFWKYLKPKYAFLYSCFPKKTNSLSIEELTLQKIVALEQRSWIKEGQLNIFYQEISWIIRNFIEKKWSINAPELTTEEFLAKVQIHPLFSTPERLSLQQFLEESDLVKFSKWIPEQKQAYKVLSYAKAFIIR